uniref:Nucleoplasmin core domain-containing protein n=1 Tax=Strigamia maritima TaxID=126957 RepID=T1IKG4_STRMM
MADDIQRTNWGCELNKNQRTVKWGPIDRNPCWCRCPKNNHLLLEYAMLGDTAVVDELNVVNLKAECETVNRFVNWDIFQLKRGTTVNYINLDFDIKNYCVLQLVCGSGPVFMTGVHVYDKNLFNFFRLDK